ncbi:unnamed protein product [Absidia cylindrospora]
MRSLKEAPTTTVTCRVLQYIENYNTQTLQRNGDIQTTATYDWGKSMVYGYDPIVGKGRQSQARLVNRLRYLVNHPDTAIDSVVSGIIILFLILFYIAVMFDSPKSK